MTTPNHRAQPGALIARFLKARGVDRVFALCGGHIMPMWMRLDAEGIRIVDVRDERAAVYMAHAHAELTGGLGVALVTAGPGVTNAMTGIANAHVARAPVLVLSGTPPRAQENRGALQDMVHTDLVRAHALRPHGARAGAWCCRSSTRRSPRAFGQGGEPGPVYLDFPVDTLRVERARGAAAARAARSRSRDGDPARPRRRAGARWTALVGEAAAGHPGRGARGAGRRWTKLLDTLGALYLDTGESRGLVPDEHASVVAAMRGSVMSEADLVHHRRPPARLPARLRLAGGVRRCKARCASPTVRPSCATTGAARSRSCATPADALEGDRSPLPRTARRRSTRLGARRARQPPRARRQAAASMARGARRPRRPDAPEQAARRATRGPAAATPTSSPTAATSSASRASACRRRPISTRAARLHRRRHALRHRGQPGAARTAL